VYNAATADGEDPGGDPVDPPGDDEEVPAELKPGIDLDKQAELTGDANGNGKADVGDEITFSFVVTNTGNVTLTEVGVSDPMLAEVGITVTCPAAVLAAGESMTCTADRVYVVTEDDQRAGQVHNVATATGTPPPTTDPETGEEVPTPPVTDEDETTTPVPPAPEKPRPPLAQTGAEVASLGLLALALVGGGAVLTATSRKRRTE